MKRHIVMNTANALLLSHAGPLVFLGVLCPASKCFWLPLPTPVTLLVKNNFRLQRNFAGMLREEEVPGIYLPLPPFSVLSP